MGKLAQRFLDAAKSGVYRAADAGIPREAAREAGLALLEVSLEGVADKGALLQRIAASFAFPDWFGGNWDALEDCLTDLSWQEAAGYVLLLHGADELAQRCPDDFGVLIDVLGESAQYWRERRAPFFAVAIDPRLRLAFPVLYNERLR
ncbi:MAG: barstar family protein [Betaproteobacteria bacterium]|nr:barstar family protein [Betaproteobacteria bacterium]